MRIVFGALVIQWTAFVMLTGMALWIGHRQPPSLAVRQFHLLDCAPPCWVGIVPGQTPIDEAMRRFRLAFPLPDNRPSEFPPNISITYGLEVLLLDNDGASYATSIMLEFVEGIADGVTIQTPRQTDTRFLPTLGDLVVLLGMPSCFAAYEASPGGYSLFYYLPEGTAHVAVIGWDVEWTTPILSYFMTNRPIPGLCQENPDARPFNPNR